MQTTLYRQATDEEQERITIFLSREFLRTEYGWAVEKALWAGKETKYDLAIEAELTCIANLIEESILTTYPNFFPDGDLIDLRLWPMNFLNTFQQFKQRSDGTLTRLKPSTLMAKATPHDMNATFEHIHLG